MDIEFIKKYRNINTGDVDEVVIRWNGHEVEAEWDHPDGSWTTASFCPVEEDAIEEEADWLMSQTHKPV